MKNEKGKEFRVRPNRPRVGGQSDVRAWSIALRTVLRYASGSKRFKLGASQSPSARKVFSQRCAVRIVYSRNKTPGQWRAHGRYIARENAGNPSFGPFRNQSPGRQHEDLAVGKVLDRWQSDGDQRLWKLIVSPEFGERVDLQQFTQDLMARMEKDLGTRLEWVAVPHFNTEHPHVHVALRGVRHDGSPLDLPRDYVKNGVRAVAEDLCTRQLGHRTELDVIESERREIRARRFTSLDRRIGTLRSADETGVGSDAEHFRVLRPVNLAQRPREQHIEARLLVLQQMGLAIQVGPHEWNVRRDFETVLKAMQKAVDRQKMLAAHGTLLSDERLPLAVLDMRKLKMLEGRVLGHGEDEVGVNTGRHYLLLEGTDAKVHLVYYTSEMERARSLGKLRSNSFVRLQKQFENGRPSLEIIDLGDAEKILRDKDHFRARAAALAGARARLSESGWGGWIGRYHSAMAAVVSDLENQKTTRGAARGR